jgi:hypothetical protein
MTMAKTRARLICPGSVSEFKTFRVLAKSLSIGVLQGIKVQSSSAFANAFRPATADREFRVRRKINPRCQIIILHNFTVNDFFWSPEDEIDAVLQKIEPIRSNSGTQGFLYGSLRNKHPTSGLPLRLFAIMI